MEKLFENLEIDAQEKEALQEAFEQAVLKKTTELIDEHLEERLTEEKEKLEEEYKEKVEYLTEALDGYLNTVVEEFIQENAPVYEAEIEQEKVKTLLEYFDKMVQVVGADMIQIHEDASEANTIAALEEKVSDLADKLIEAKREADEFMKLGVIKELSEGLTMLEADKFAKLADMVPFTRDSSYIEKLEVIKESIIDNRPEDFNESEVKLPENAFKEKELDPKKAMDFSKFV